MILISYLKDVNLIFRVFNFVILSNNCTALISVNVLIKFLTQPLKLITMYFKILHNFILTKLKVKICIA